MVIYEDALITKQDFIVFKMMDMEETKATRDELVEATGFTRAECLHAKQKLVERHLVTLIFSIRGRYGDWAVEIKQDQMHRINRILNKFKRGNARKF